MAETLVLQAMTVNTAQDRLGSLICDYVRVAWGDRLFGSHMVDPRHDGAGQRGSGYPPELRAAQGSARGMANGASPQPDEACVSGLMSAG